MTSPATDAICLITGGAGFIGSHLCDALLQSGQRIVVLDDLSTGSRENLSTSGSPAGNIPIEQIRLGDPDTGPLRELFDRWQPRTICHLAAQSSVARSMRAPERDAASNLLGTIQLLEQARRCRVERFLFASTGGAIYGNVAGPAREDHPPAPRSAYGLSKWACEQYLQLYARNWLPSVVVLRYANVYGSRQDPLSETGVIATFCSALLQGQPARIMGSARISRDFIHVTDVVRATCLALQSPQLASGLHCFNVGTGQPTRLEELLQQIASLLQQSWPTDPCAPELSASGSTEKAAVLPDPLFELIDPRPGDLSASVLDCRRMADQLGWQAQIDLRSGLQQTLDWYRSRPR